MIEKKLIYFFYGGKNLTMLKASMRKFPSSTPSIASTASSQEDKGALTNEDSVEVFVRQERERRMEWNGEGRRGRDGDA